MSLLERAWAQREEVSFPRLFGPLEQGIYTLSPELFATFGVTEIDPRWLHLGVMLAPPTPVRSSWVYVTSGLSSPWESEEPEELSGVGYELVFELPVRADWAIQRLQHLLAFQQLLAVGWYPGKPLLAHGDRVPLRGSLVPGAASKLTFLLCCEGVEPASGFDLESGHVDLLYLVGVTESEAQFARETRSEELISLLRAAGIFPVTLPERDALV